ncbi:MAG: hypothetical protein RR215_06920 [Ruthenibacterium sp.]
MLLLYGLFACALWRSGELILTQTVVQRTLNKDDTGAGQVRLFGLAYREESRPYKQKMTAETAADVLVLGTSRSMQFRGAFFETDSFYNAGGALPILPRSICCWCLTNIFTTRHGPQGMMRATPAHTCLRQSFGPLPRCAA